MNIEAARKICQDFANKHKIVFQDNGEVGFGRPCVGFTSGDNYIDYNPCSHPDYEPIPELQSKSVYAPDDVNSYHKHDCLAVLGTEDESIIGLAKWVQKLESNGTVEIVDYKTGATGIKAMISGVFGKCVVVK